MKYTASYSDSDSLNEPNGRQPVGGAMINNGQQQDGVPLNNRHSWSKIKSEKINKSKYEQLKKKHSDPHKRRQQKQRLQQLVKFNIQSRTDSLSPYLTSEVSEFSGRVPLMIMDRDESISSSSSASKQKLGKQEEESEKWEDLPPLIPIKYHSGSRSGSDNGFETPSDNDFVTASDNGSDPGSLKK